MDKVDATKGATAVQEVHKVQAVHEKADALRNAKVAEFVAAYEKLIGRLKGNRKLVIVPPTWFESHGSDPTPVDWSRHNDALTHYAKAVESLAAKLNIEFIPSFTPARRAQSNPFRTRDGVHHSALGQLLTASLIKIMLTESNLVREEWRKLDRDPYVFDPSTFMKAGIPMKELEKIDTLLPLPFGDFYGLRPIVTAKNRLWFHYYRPQNWAFLAGDRTNQPSSRDHLDPSKRWFPEELEKFVPLIDAKDAEIWALAKKLK